MDINDLEFWKGFIEGEFIHLPEDLIDEVVLAEGISSDDPRIQDFLSQEKPKQYALFAIRDWFQPSESLVQQAMERNPSGRRAVDIIRLDETQPSIFFRVAKEGIGSILTPGYRKITGKGVFMNKEGLHQQAIEVWKSMSFEERDLVDIDDDEAILRADPDKTPHGYFGVSSAKEEMELSPLFLHKKGRGALALGYIKLNGPALKQFLISIHADQFTIDMLDIVIANGDSPAILLRAEGYAFYICTDI